MKDPALQALIDKRWPHLGREKDSSLGNQIARDFFNAGFKEGTTNATLWTSVLFSFLQHGGWVFAYLLAIGGFCLTLSLLGTATGLETESLLMLIVVVWTIIGLVDLSNRFISKLLKLL